MGRLRRLKSGIGGVIDDVVLSALRHRFTRSPGGAGLLSTEPFAANGSEGDRQAALLTIVEHYEDPTLALFVEPPIPEPTFQTREQLDDGGQVVDLAWPSAFVPTWEAAEYDAWEPNRGVKVRALLHRQPATTIIVCLHGYQGGSWFLEERAFQARWLYALGADVVMPVLPFHGVRGGRGAPSWPSPNPIRTNEGFGQTISDLRQLVRWLRARPGAEAQRVAAIGMSLGGNSAALWATIDPLDFVAAMMPVASWAELVWSHGEGRAERTRAERDGITLSLMQRAMAIVTPIDRTPRVTSDQVLMFSAVGDRIAPPEHGARLARHFSGVHLTLEGGHVLQLGRRDAFTAIAQRMALLGLIEKR